MLILDTAGDTIRAEASAASSITVSCYGIETASGADTFKRLGVAQLTGSGTQDTIYTVPASTSTVCMMIVIANTSASARTIKLWDVENGGSPGDANAILGTVAIPANSSILWNKGNIKEMPTGGVGTDEKVGIDSAASAGYLGAASGDGVLRTGAGLTYVDGGDFITLATDIGIADGKILKVDHVSPADNDYAKFTANGLEGRSYAEVVSDIGALIASGFTLITFIPQCSEPPSTNFATLDTRNQHPVLDFDATTNESAVFRGIMPKHYAGGGITVYLHYAMTSAETNTVDWDVAFERIGDQQLDIDGDSFAAVQSADNTTVPGTSGLVDVVSIAFTNGAQMDSIAAGEGFRLKVTRDAASDDAAGDAELLFIEIRET